MEIVLCSWFLLLNIFNCLLIWKVILWCLLFSVCILCCSIFSMCGILICLFIFILGVVLICDNVNNCFISLFMCLVCFCIVFSVLFCNGLINFWLCIIFRYFCNIVKGVCSLWFILVKKLCCVFFNWCIWVILWVIISNCFFE